jgi:hypothetical protein
LYFRGNLGRALSIQGFLERSPQLLTEAVDQLSLSLEVDAQTGDVVPNNNLAVARRRLGEVCGDIAILKMARDEYAMCERQPEANEGPFDLAVLQWNIADLALARFRLDPDPALLTEARDRIAKARAFFVDGSDYQTERCDDLLAQVEKAEAAAIG